MKYLLIAVLSLLIIACSAPVSKKVLIMGRGKLTVQENNIAMTDGSGYVEETVEIKGDAPQTWNVTSPSGKTTVNIPEEPGFYILNLKSDTIVGSRQNLGTDLSGGRMTQEELKVKIDSLSKLVSGSNVAFGGRNYFVLPNQLIKISSNIQSKVFGPFTKIPGTLEADQNGKEPEIYKFYTNTEMRDLISNLKKLTY